MASLAVATVAALPGEGQAQIPETRAAAESLLRVDSLSAAPSFDVGLAAERVRSLYLLAVEDEDRVDEGVEAADLVRQRSTPGGAMAAFAEAYQGAFEVLRGKHAFWPHSKIQHVNRGLGLLDRAVRLHPEHVEARYLRLVSTEPLPSLFSRGESIAEDVEVLARLLPGHRRSLSPDMWDHALRMVIDSEHLSEESWNRLTRALSVGGTR